MTDIQHIGAGQRLSRVVIFKDLVFVSGQTADDRSLPIRGQVEQTLAKLDRCLAEAGTDKRRLLSVQIWLKDIARDFEAMNAVWTEWIASGPAPARATAQCEMGLPDILVEVIATAAR